MKQFSFLLLAILFSVAVFAQSSLKGKVVDVVSGKPLVGATVSFVGGAVTTDKDGRFQVNCGKTSRITISFVGYETFNQLIKNCDAELAIELKPAGIALQEVEITAATGNKSILYQPASIAKLTAVELKRGTGLFLDDVLQTNVPGVTMSRRTVGGGQQLNIRGYGNGSRGTRGISSNFDGQGYKVYLNGIPVTDAEGITTFDDIDFGSVGNVEIVKGPAGSLYGLAIAGAVNLRTTKAEKDKTSLSQEVMIGNYGLQRYTTQLQVGKEKTSLLVNYGHQKSDGFSIHNKSKKDFANIIGDFQLNDKQSLSTYVGYSNSYDERLGELTLTQWQNNDYSGNPEYIKRNAHSNVVTFRSGVAHTYNFNTHISNSTAVFGTGFSSNVSSAGGWTDKNTINYGVRSVFDTRFPLANGVALNGVTGVELQRQDGQTVGYNMKADPNDPNPGTWTYGVSPYWVVNASTSNAFVMSKTGSLFTQWTLLLPKDFSVTAGIGVSDMKIRLDDRFNPALATRPARYEKAYTGMASPQVSINKVFNKELSLYATYSKAYKAPVSSYFYITTPAVTTPATPATGRVNETLKPEIGSQYEIGSKGQTLHGRLAYELALFYATFDNKMTAVAVQSPANASTTLYSYMVNGGKQLHKGVEALLKYTVVQSNTGFFNIVRPFANLAYSDFTYAKGFTIQKSVTQTEDYSGKAVGGVAKITANIGVDVQMKYGLYANVTYNYKDKMPITSLNDYYAPGYNLLNGKIGVRQNLGNHFEVEAYAGATNLTNTKYYLMVFVNQLPDAYIPAPKTTNFFGGINLKYNF